MATLRVDNNSSKLGVKPINGNVGNSNMVRYKIISWLVDINLRPNEFLAFAFNIGSSPNFYVPLFGKFETCFYPSHDNETGLDTYKLGVSKNPVPNITYVDVELMKMTVDYAHGRFVVHPSPYEYECEWDVKFEFYHDDVDGKELLFVQCGADIRVSTDHIELEFCYPDINGLYVTHRDTNTDMTYGDVLRYNNTRYYTSFVPMPDRHHYDGQFLVFIMTKD